MPETVKGMDALIRRMKAIGETKPVMRALQFSTIHEAQRLVPRKTGALQRSIGPGRLTDDVAEVVANVPYAAAVEYGSRPHTIVPKRAKVLAWGGSRRLSGRLRSGASADTFAMRVEHPGNKAKPYLIPGAKEAIKKAGLDEVVEVWNKAGMTARVEIVAQLGTILDAFIAANPTLLVRRFKVRPPSLVTDTPCAYIDLRPYTVAYFNSVRDVVMSPSIVFVDRLTDNGETMERFDILVDTFTEFLDDYPYLAAGNAVWSSATWADESETLGGGDTPTQNAAAARVTFNDTLYKSPRS